MTQVARALIGLRDIARVRLRVDGSDAAAERLQRVLTTDPGTGVMRHVDAGYEEALDAARSGGLDLPSVPLEN